MAPNLEKMSRSGRISVNEGYKVYSFEEARKASTDYFKGDELAATTWINKYALKDNLGNLYEKNPDEMHHRLAGEIARIESKYPNPMKEDEIYKLLKDFKYIIPQGGPMTGIGNNFQVSSLSNCFVIGYDEDASDSYGTIMKVDQEQVQLMKRRGGVGHDLSYIRPRGSPVLNSAMTSTGIVPFMERYSNSTREVAQEGRRGALMLSLSIKHPDAEEFIDAKMTPGKITGANISVMVDNEFMKAVINNDKYVQQWPINSENPLVKKEINPKKLWNKIIHNAWKSAEPGVLFWDTVKREAIPDVYTNFGYKTVSTNPCGEIPLCPYDSCRLLALNLYSYVDNPFTTETKFNHKLFKKHAGIAQRIMDDIIDLEIEKIDAILDKIGNDPEEKDVKYVEKKLWENIRYKAEEGRRTGLGVTGEGDMLAALDLRYGSEQGIEHSIYVHKTLALEAYRNSVEMVKEGRKPFGIYNAELEKDNPFIQRLKKEDENLYNDMVEHGRRNIALLTIAPTGTTSIMTQTTSGIEPVYLPSYKRRRKVDSNTKKNSGKIAHTDEMGDEWEEFNVFHHGFVNWLEINGYNPEEVKKYDDEELEKVIEKSPYYNASSNDVDWLSKVKMQGEIQKWVDHSISVTINLPSDVSEELVGKLYETAWESGCKGVTVYRDGSREGILSSGKDKGGLEKIFPDERPEEVKARIFRFKNENGKMEDWVAFTGVIGKKPYETFTGKDDPEDFHVPSYINSGFIIKTKDKKGETRYDFKYINKYDDDVTLPGISHAFNPEFHNYAILFSRLLQQEMPINKILKTANKMKSQNESINSWIRGFTRSLKPFAEGEEALGEKCDSCNAKGSLIYQEGCLMCTSCGNSKCG